MKGFAHKKEAQKFVFFSHLGLTFLFFCHSINGLYKKPSKLYGEFIYCLKTFKIILS